MLALLGTWLKENQRLEDFVWEVVPQIFDIESDLDFVLDAIGKIVGRGRKGQANAAYRVSLRAQIRINRSHGRTEDLLDVARLSVNDETITFAATDVYPGAVQITMSTQLGVDLGNLWENLQHTKGGGVRLHFVFPAGGENANDFQFSPSHGLEPDERDMSDDQRGWSSETVPSLGGHLMGEFVG